MLIISHWSIHDISPEPDLLLTVLLVEGTHLVECLQNVSSWFHLCCKLSLNQRCSQEIMSTKMTAVLLWYPDSGVLVYPDWSGVATWNHSPLSSRQRHSQYVHLQLVELQLEPDWAVCVAQRPNLTPLWHEPFHHVIIGPFPGWPTVLHHRPTKKLARGELLACRAVKVTWPGINCVCPTVCLAFSFMLYFTTSSSRTPRLFQGQSSGQELRSMKRTPRARMWWLIESNAALWPISTQISPSSDAYRRSDWYCLHTMTHSKPWVENIK